MLPAVKETLWLGGTILPVDPRAPRADAMLTRDNRIVAVGSTRDVRRAAGSDHVWIDLEGRTVVPGFNDAHIHLFIMGDHALSITLHGLSKKQIIDRLRHGAPLNAGTESAAEEPLVAYGWDFEYCPDPHCRDLDEAFPERPVILFQFSGHGAWLNTAGLRYFGIGEETEDWSMGGPDRDQGGALTGVLREPQNYAPIQRFRSRRMQDAEHIRLALRTALRRLAKHGITSIQDNTWWPWLVPQIARLHRNGELSCRLSCWSYGKDPSLDRSFRFKRFNKDWYHRGPVKHFWDGAFSSYTAWLAEPYSDRPDTRGQGTSAEEIAGILRRETRRGRQVAAHSIGDAATAAYVEAVNALPNRSKAGRLRHRIEHGQLIRREDIPRIRELGMIVSAQPHAAGDPVKDTRLIGPERLAGAYPYRSLLDAGVPLVFGSDFPGENSFDPLFGMHLAVNRSGGEAITPQEALACYTAGGAYAEWREDCKGRLRPGYLADLAVLSADPTRVNAADIRRIEVDATVVDGRIVFEREGRELRRSAPEETDA